MTTTYSKYITLEELTCGNCGITFAVPEHWLAERRENGGGFTCPNGDERVFLKSEVAKLREKLERAQAREKHLQDQREAAERHASAMKGQVTRLKNRAKAGVCPCCNRSFVQLQRHMKSKHPDFDPAS